MNRQEWNGLKEWAKAKGAKIRKPFFEMERIEFPKSNVGLTYVIFENGCAGAWHEKINAYGKNKRFYVETESYKSAEQLKKIVEDLEII